MTLDGKQLAKEFPKLENLLHPKQIRFGLEWAYVMAQNQLRYQKEDWSAVPGTEAFEHEDTAYIVMQKGTPTTNSVAFVPQISVDIPISSSAGKAS